MAAILEEHGITSDTARRAVVAFAETAHSLVTNHGGKVQRYLRHYGELMLNELGDHFAFSDLKPDDVGMAFTMWFQNCLNLPLSLVDSDLIGFCSERDIAPSALIAAADELDVNLALVDDLTQLQVRVDEALAKKGDSET